MRLRPLTPRAILVPGSGLRITATAAATMSTKARVISSTSGPMLGAEERGRGEIERELLHRRIEQHRSRLRLPLRDPRRDPGIEFGEIGFHRPGLERHRQRAPVQPVLVEIEQHQPARKQQVRESGPSHGSRRTAWPGRTAPARWPPARAALGWFRRKCGCDRRRPYLAACRSTWPLGSARMSSVLPINGQPSSPGICVSELRFGGVRLIAGETTLCIDMAMAPVGLDAITGPRQYRDRRVPRSPAVA